ncbi:MAG: hypothetical protein HYY16_09420 [Planctomycetes bacterium]|nr:hypothetical protein [Planctomycetota bacterium]
MTRDRFAPQRGVSMVVVVIVVVVTIILTVTGLLLHARLGHLELVQKNLKKIRDDEQRRADALSLSIREELKPTGLYAGEDPKALPVNTVGEELKKRQEAAFQPVEEKFSAFGESRENLAALEARLNEKGKQGDLYATLQALLPLAASRLLYEKNLNDQLTLQQTIAENHAKALSDMKGPVTQRKIDAIAHLRQQIQEVNRKIDAEDQTFSAKQQELINAKTSADAAIAQENADFYTWERNTKNDIREKQRQLEELRVKEAIKVEVRTAHGHVLRPDVGAKIAFIDIGSRDLVVPGLKLMAAKSGDQGRLVYKAQLEVKKVWPTYAEVSITQILTPDMPVIEGDLIVNPLFHTRRPIVVAFAGVKEPKNVRPAWSVDEASRRIKEIGGEVQAETTPQVDFVILTEPSEQPADMQNFNRAAILGVPYLEAAEVYQFLGD